MSTLPPTNEAIKQTIMDKCEKDDVSGVAEWLNMAASFGHKGMVNRLLHPCLRHAAMFSSSKVIVYLIEQGADVTTMPGGLLITAGTPSTRETLEVLVANGWDINRSNGGRDAPVLWYLLEDKDLVEWCLDHGAILDPPDDTPPDCVGRTPILERAAPVADIATFELLRAKGAPLCHDYGVFPLAVMAANDYAPEINEIPSTKYQQRMDMVRHLVDVVGCDVNSKSNGPYRWVTCGSVCSTPLCLIACHPRGDARDLIWFLLDRGGDLDLARPNEGVWCAPSAREAAARSRDTRFMKAVEEWQAKREGDAE